MKTFAIHVIKSTIAGDEIDAEKYFGYFQSHDDLKASYNCVLFLVTSAVKYGVGKDVFTVELQQLGLSKEHSVALGKVLHELAPNLFQHLQARKVSVRKPSKIEIETIQDPMQGKMMQMNISYTESYQEKTEKIKIKEEHAHELLKELKRIQFIMKDYSQS